jgi:hypothetical protein
MAEATNHRTDASAAIATEGNNSPDSTALDHIRDALRGLRFGLVSIVVQDGVVIQIERTERRRLR